MALAGAWTNSSSNSKCGRFLKGPKLAGGKLMQILGQANRTGLVLLGEAWVASSSVLRGAGRQRSGWPRIAGGPESCGLSWRKTCMGYVLTLGKVRTDSMGRADTFEEVIEVERGSSPLKPASFTLV